MPDQQNRNARTSPLMTIFKLVGLLYLYNIARNSEFLNRSANAFQNGLDIIFPPKPQNYKSLENEEFCEQTQKNTYEKRDSLFLPDSTKRITESKISPEEALSTENFFGGSAMHVNIMNQYYKAALSILEKFPTKREEILNQKDFNGRTPLHLALEVGAPEAVISNLLTRENILIADKEGITPFMLAARGLDRETMTKIFETIPESNLREAVEQKDKNGRTALDWNKMSKEEMIKRFHKFEMDGTRDSEYCTGSLFFSDIYSFLSSPTFSDEAKKVFEEVGLEIGANFWASQEYVGIKATKDNAQKLIRFANEDSVEANNARQKLSDFWFQSSDKNSDFWRYISEQAARVEPNLSGISLVDRYKENQKNIFELLQTCKPRENSEIILTESQQLRSPKKIMEESR